MNEQAKSRTNIGQVRRASEVRKSRAWDNCRGFSFFQVLFVVTIAVLSASLVIPQISSLGARYDLKAETDALASQLHAARTLAISSGSPHSVIFNIEKGTVELVDSANPQKVVGTVQALKGIQVQSDGNVLTFGARGTTKPAKIVLTNSRGDQTAVVIGAAGKVNVGRLEASGTSVSKSY